MEYWSRPRLYALLPVVNSHRLPAKFSDTASDEQSVAGLGVYAGPAPLTCKSAIDLPTRQGAFYSDMKSLWKVQL